MLSQTKIPHIKLEELSQMKIPALKGRARANNLLILETIASEGSLLKYGVHKTLKKKGIAEYSTVTRRIDSLRKKGYLDEAGKRITERGKRKAESMYGLTWKGFIASLLSEKVRGNALQVIERNPLLAFTEKELIISVLREIVTPQELNDIITSILTAYLRVIPNLETIREENLWIWFFEIREISFPEKFQLKKIPQDLLELLDNPIILQIIKERILPIISEYEEKFYVLFQFFKVLNELGAFIKKLRPEDKPSERVKKYLKTFSLEEKLLELETQ